MTMLIATTSTLAALVGIAAIVPQLIKMVTTRSSAGQSTIGWSLGLTTNTALALVNLLGYHAVVLGSGNLVSLSGCVTAMYLVRRFRAGADSPENPVADLRTQEFEVLREAVLAEHHRRSGARELATQLP